MLSGDLDTEFALINLIPGEYFDGVIDWKAEFKNFPYRLKKSREDSIPSTKKLLDFISGAVLRSLEGSDGCPLLLLSSGKDSIGLAIGLSEAGIRVNTLSLVKDPTEHSYIKKIARNLGHYPNFVPLDAIRAKVLSTDFSLRGRPICFDQALLFFRAALEHLGVGEKELLIDGMGNDIYFGHIPSKVQLRAYAIYKCFGPLFAESDYGRVWLRDFPAANGMTTAFGRMRASRAIREHIPMMSFPSNLFRPSCSEDFVDMRGFLRGSYVDNFVYSEKTRVLAQLFKSKVVFPWQNGNLSEFCFNLPRKYRFSLDTMTNKILLRRLLAKKIGYNQPKRGIDLYESYSSEEVYNAIPKSGLLGDISHSVLTERLVPENIRKRALFELFIYSRYL